MCESTERTTRALGRALDITFRDRIAHVTAQSKSELETGMLSVVQRTDPALRLNVLALDGA